MYALLLPAAAVAGYGVYRHISRWRRGQPAARFDRPAARVRLVLKHAVAQRRTARDLYAGLFHQFVSYGFVVLTIATTVVALDADFGTAYGMSPLTPMSLAPACAPLYVYSLKFLSLRLPTSVTTPIFHVPAALAAAELAGAALAGAALAGAGLEPALLHAPKMTAAAANSASGPKRNPIPSILLQACLLTRRNRLDGPLRPERWPGL